MADLPGRVLFFFVFSSVDPSLRLEHKPIEIGNGCGTHTVTCLCNQIVSATRYGFTTAVS
jgi:hypothetical protein